ncbi:MAG: type IV pilus twitching motility protein PilT [Armatimonadetes bacterium]|nr:type IV pilus twitching motility protein PilT [Armatimonadota bacterium]
MVLDDLLKEMVERKASDLHMAVGSVPMFRIDGHLTPTDHEVMQHNTLQEMVYNILNYEQRETFEKEKELDFSYSIPGLSRFRGNVLLQRGTMGAVFRMIPSRPLTLKELSMPDVLTDLAAKPRGLVLVTGPTGSGKSTTLAAMIDHINENDATHIVTIEDPIEFLHKNKKSIIRQRELGQDTHSFANALKHVLRQDPDVILVGEMRDLETIGLAVTAAETGHLVFGTLHTTGAAPTVDRIVDVFPPHQQQQIRMQMSTIFEGIVSQTLVPKADGKGRVCALEIMVGTAGVRNLIREGKTHQLINMIQSGAQHGMISLDSSLKKLWDQKLITEEDALLKSSSPEELKRLMGKG